MAPPVPSTFKSQGTNNNHRAAGIARQSDDDEEPAMPEEDMEDMEEFEAEEAALMMDEEEDGGGVGGGRGGKLGGGRTGRQSAPLPITAGGDFKCSVCDFTTRSRVTLQRHERLTHLKKKFFRCVKCNYVTHVKARYTKHVKYHSMPMIKCDLCEFRTPYKWNLDRHLKNHMGGGMYQCSLCNFTAHIKQSLTVHIQNHHLSPDKARSARRRNKVGASDQLNEVSPAETAMDADEAELLRLERMEHDARSQGGLRPLPDDDDDEGELEGVDHDEELAGSSSKADREDFGFLHPDDLTQKNGRLYSTGRSRSQCSQYKPVWGDGDLIRQPAGKVNGEMKTTNVGGQMSPVNYSLAVSPPELVAPKKNAPRPIPNLIPIAQSGQPTTSPAAAATILKIPQIQMREWDEEPSSSSILEAVGLLAKNQKAAAAVADETRKRKSGFLDQLAQKLAGCSNNESSRSEDSHPLATASVSTNISWSSRCQHCRQRCKTRADLLSHLKQCPRALQAASNEESEESAASATTAAQPHPMENKVFVWNQSMAAEEESNTESETDAMMMMMMMEEEENKRPSSVAGSDVSEASLVGIETAPGIGAVTGGAGAPAAGSLSMELRSTVRRVYRCPQCSFWATTASRFHVHMVGHTNTKPFECSQCAYRSNWRWDITKHIKLKAARDPAHTQARVLLLDSSGERHYDQYDRYLVMMRVTESGGPAVTHGRFAMEEMGRRAAASSSRRTDSLSPSPSPSPVPSPVPVAAPAATATSSTSVESLPFNLSAVSLATSLASIASSLLPPPPAIRQLPSLNAIHPEDSQHLTTEYPSPTKSTSGASTNPRRTIWKCKRCVFKHKDKRMVLAHMAKHTRRDNFSCGLCGKGSNWQSVIRRHCRLKHNGNIQVIENRVTDEDGPELSREGDDLSISPLNGRAGKKTAKRESPLPDEDSMGYMMHADVQQYSCAICPFACKSLTDIEVHRQHHKTGSGRPIRCPICPFFVTDKQELAQHLVLHGMHDLKLDSSGQLSCSVEKQSHTAEQSSSGRRFRCSSCPYVSDNKSQYVYHRQFHRPRGAPYKCSQCSYNVSRRHLLNQHLSVHGLPPVGLLDGENYASDSDAIGSEAEAEAEAAEAIEMADDEVMVAAAEDHSPTPISACSSSSAVAAASSSGIGSEGYTHLGLDPNTIARLPDSATVSLLDIPLTWVSRGSKFYKMFKCRHCPHVNVRKANIQEHEKRHQTKPGSSAAGGGGDNMHACSMCNYRCNNAGVLSAHVKVHQNVLGIIHALADPSRSDEEQLRQLAGVAGFKTGGEASTLVGKEAEESCSSLSSSGSAAPQPKLDLLLGRAGEDAKDDGGKKLHFCAHCPARFLVETELLIHQRFHGVKLAFRCDVCSYTARQENHLLAHWKVHSREYQERTKVLVEHHGASEQHPQPRILAVQPNSSADEEEGAIDLTSRKESEVKPSPIAITAEKTWANCPLCPARFDPDSKALQYHISLHGGNGPFRCRFCNYAVKAQDNLTKHEKLHLHHLHQTEDEDELTAETSTTDNNTKPLKRFQCSKCPSSFEKKEQFKVHSNLHGSKQRYRCDRCDYAVKYYTNFLQHMKRHDESETAAGGETTADEAMDVETHELPPTTTVPTIQLPEQPLSTADRQHIWLQDKLRSVQHQSVQQPFSCQYCPYRCGNQEDLISHIDHHAANGATGSFRCNFCDFTVMIQEELSEHIGLHFQLKGRKAAKLPESYWKCSNLEIWSEPVNPEVAGTEPEIVYDEKTKNQPGSDDDEEEDEDALYIDLSTGHPVRDETATDSASVDPES
ncbi:uncharacterized protein LOC124209404 isoform X7 [Daphnia pulex]|uniref:uncharacterized protein LOC124209404 isoform X7 n=1 Tax=Daphnia pulex TaxID=6669 RepID=UPI001EDE5875|nr:uncharacterized protein LOC124209404 isoform X7 [Daphnia pulex]